MAGEVFYQRLFELAPALVPLFGGASIEQQSAKLMNTLAYLVDHLDDWAQCTAMVEALGARHVLYGAQSDHYAAVGAALISMLGTILRRQFSDATEEAWTELYSQISLLMEKGARDATLIGKPLH
jgi:hemoglobin-like flavoprotein